MKSRWNDDEARSCCRRFAEHGEALALRVYTSHLIGSDDQLVLHGGGNTSVKRTAPDLFGRPIDVMHVKGSGSDLRSVEPRGLPGVRLEPLRELERLDRLGDEEMVNAVRGALLDSTSPNPSVEALLHAFLPHRYVDHTHADAILALTDQPDGEDRVRDAFGDDVAVLPWIMPGFPLAKAVASAYRDRPECLGVVLRKHGLFTFAEDARESYERMISLVDRAEHYISRHIGGVPAMLCGEPEPLRGPERQHFLCEAMPSLRGAIATRRPSPCGDLWQRVVADVRIDDDLAAFSAHSAARELCSLGPITPDHVIRTKGSYLFLSREEAGRPDTCHRAVATYVASYRRYYDEHCRRLGSPMIAPQPRVAVIEGVGLVAFGETRKAARIAADIAEHTLRVKAAAHALGRFEPLSPGELAEMEYWPLERNKLRREEPEMLRGQVALVTGAAGAIGGGIVEALLAHGACVLATDLDAERLEGLRARHAGAADRLHTVAADLCDEHAIHDVFAACCRTFGGVDCVVPNAGIALVSSLEDMDVDRFRRVIEVNTTATMRVMQCAARAMKRQQTGGSIVLQASKNTFAPGRSFGAYSASKAAALQLARIAAMEFAEFGVRVNAINADAVFGDEKAPSQLWAEVGPDRMRARGLDAKGLREFYRERSLLGVEVLPRHIGEATAFFAAGLLPTTGAVLPVDGGLPEAFPR